MYLLKRLLLYAVGLFIMAVGVSFSVLSGLGVSPIDTIPYVTSEILQWDMGLCTAIIFTLYVVLQFCILRKDFPLRNLCQILVGVCFGSFISITNRLLEFALPTTNTYILQLLYVFISMACIGCGISLYIQANIISMPAEGVAQAISQKSRLELPTAKIVFDWSVVAASLILCLAFLPSIRGIREGTLLAAFGVGLFLKLSLKLFQPSITMFLSSEGKK